MELEHGSGSSKNQNVHPAATSNDEDPLIQDKIPDYSSSFSSSSSSSSSNPLELDVDEKDLLDNLFTKSVEDGPRLPTPDPRSLPDVSSHTPQWSMISASPRDGSGTETGVGLLLSPEASPPTSEWSTLNASPKKSPTIQVMGHPAGYDPNRIPSSVFATKSTAGMEWSVASNESLFSIHMGNNSFSRDHAILLSKSGEFNRPDDWLNSPYSATEAKSNDLNSMSSGLPTVIETAAEIDRKSASTIEEESGEKEEVSEAHYVVSNDSPGDLEKEKLPTSEGYQMSGANFSVSDGNGAHPADGPRNSASTPRLSDESGNSASSFAFPVLGGEGGGSVKGDNEKPAQPPQPKPQPEPEPQTPVATPKAGGNRWFSCFPRCPLCC